jgi:hypothetical protein
MCNCQLCGASGCELHGIHVQDYEFGAGVFKRAMVCEECEAVRLDMDMWTCRQHWEAPPPVTPFVDLPNCDGYDGEPLPPRGTAAA